MADPTDDVGASMRKTYEQCSTWAGVPNAMIMPGSTLNTLMDTTIYEPDASYLIMSGTISKIED